MNDERWMMNDDDDDDDDESARDDGITPSWKFVFNAIALFVGWNHQPGRALFDEGADLYRFDGPWS